VSTVGDYQSAVQLVVGANLAFFTFPELRQPSLPQLVRELSKWSVLLRSVPASEPQHDLVRAGELKVRAIRRNVEQKLHGVRILCLVIGASYAALLLWMCHAAGHPTDGTFLEIACVLGALPAAIVAFLNLSVSRSILAASDSRQRLEGAIISRRPT
jgi:hypothetical protein